MNDIYSYEDMIAACDDCSRVLEKMKSSVASFETATGIYSVSIKDKISAAANKLVDELNAIIASSQIIITKMNQMIGQSGEEFAELEDQGEGEINDI